MIAQSRGGSMRTEDVPLDIKEIFERKKVVYKPSDVARVRYMCRQFVEHVIECQKRGESSE